MHSLIVLYPRPDDPDAFKEYYRTKHIPLAAKLPGLRGYSYGYPEALGPGQPAHFCMFEGRFDSLESMLAALSSNHGKKVAADVPNYSPNGAVLMHLADEAGK
jgi:uncharacterized protein (TIGR02118 family)